MKFRVHLVSAALAAAACAAAQSSIPSTAPVQAITNARIEVGNGTVIEKGNVVMREGIIVAVGPNAQVPPGAQIFDAKGMTIFPGFIEGYTTKGVIVPEPPKVKTTAPEFSDYTPAFMPEENRKGIHPDLLASTAFQPADDVLKPYRTAGFTTALVVPPGYIGGEAAVMQLGDRSPAKSTLVPRAGMGISFGGVQGSGYPGSLLGIIAQIRQALADSITYARQASAYRQGGSRRPTFDDGIAAIAEGQSYPTLFDVNSAAEIDRILRMSDEFQLRPAIVGGSEAWRRLEEIKQRQIPVIVQLSYGPEPKAPPSPDAQKPDLTKPPQEKQADDPGDEDIESAERIDERRRVYRESVTSIKLLNEQGIPIAFTTKGTRNMAEFMANLRRAVKEGLPRERALSALTIDAARLLKLDSRLGTIEVGKIANVSVFSSDFLDEKTKVKMLYIDGERYDPDAGDPPAAPRRRFGSEERE
jgi:hypothetical protein